VIRTFPTTAMTSDEARAIRSLMDRAFAHDEDGSFEDADWEHALGGLHVVAEERGRIVAHASVVRRILVAGATSLPTGYVEAVATEPDRQGEGHGTTVMHVVGEHIAATYDLGALGTGSFHFYERLGWRRWAGPTGVRRADGRVDRTPDEDGYVMVLRTPSTPPLDEAALLTCEERPGDVW
jgi:aminoglycoside 2'-N-acetyltransferase I